MQFSCLMASGNGVEDDAATASMSERYRQLSHFVEQRRPQLVHPTDVELLSLVQQANQMPHMDQTPTERLLDAKLFRSLTRCGDVKARRLSFGSTPHTPLEIVLAIREKYKVEATRIEVEGEDWVAAEGEALTFDWERMGDDVMGVFNAGTGLKCMKGFMTEIEKKQRAAPVRRKKEVPKGSAQAPDKHAARDLTKSATDTERIVHQLWSILQREDCEGGVSLWQLTLDPDSYPQTVVNMFNVMFLIKDHKVSSIVQSDGEIVIKPAKQQNARNRMEDNRQMFITVTYHQWQQWCRKVPRELCRMCGGGVSEDDAEREQLEENDDGETVGEEPRTVSGKKSHTTRRDSGSSSRRRRRRLT